MKKIIFCFFILVTSNHHGFSQENPAERPFKKLHFNLSFLPIPTQVLPNQGNYSNFIVGGDIYTKVATNWEAGLTSYHIWLLPEGSNPLRYGQHYFISSIYARYYFTTKPYKFFWDYSFGKGNLCPCSAFNGVNAFKSIRRIGTTEGNYIGTSLGFVLKLSPSITLKPNIKAFYLINQFPETSFHIRPLLTFEFVAQKKLPAVINNPRL
jgi:hypothetical protein